MNDTQKAARLYDALKRIASYDSPEKLRRYSLRAYGLEDANEAIEYACENVRAGIAAGNTAYLSADDPLIGCMDASEFVPAGSTSNYADGGPMTTMALARPLADAR